MSASDTGCALPTVTFTAAETPVLPASSSASAVSATTPLATVVESQLIEYGSVVSEPTILPSTRKRTSVTPRLSVAVASSVTVPGVCCSARFSAPFWATPPACTPAAVASSAPMLFTNAAKPRVFRFAVVAAWPLAVVTTGGTTASPERPVNTTSMSCGAICPRTSPDGFAGVCRFTYSRPSR